MNGFTNLPGPGDFIIPDPGCLRYAAADFGDEGPDWCLEHDQAWSECGGQSDD